MAVAFGNIFMLAVETEILNLSKTKPLERRRYIDNINFLIVENWEETGITLQLKLRLKYLIKRQTFWIQLFTKARDCTIKESLTFTCISNWQRLFNTRFSLPVTLTGSEKVSKKGKALRLLRTISSAKTFLWEYLQLKKKAFALEVILTIS